MITSTGEFCDTKASSAGLEKSSMMSPNSEIGCHSTRFDFHSMERICPTMLLQLLVIATLLPIFELVRRNVVRRPSGPPQ
jgi:hypothetical protein